jgi:hypothetical protein
MAAFLGDRGHPGNYRTVLSDYQALGLESGRTRRVIAEEGGRQQCFLLPSAG